MDRAIAAHREEIERTNQRGGRMLGDPNFCSFLTWPRLLPACLEVSGIDPDRPFPLEHLGSCDPKSARMVLEEVRRRRAALPGR